MLGALTILLRRVRAFVVRDFQLAVSYRLEFFMRILTSLAVLNYFMTGFSSLANAIRSEQMQGTLESVLLSPISVPTLLVASSAWDFVLATFHSSLYLFFGWLFFNVHYRGNFLLALLFLLLTTFVLACIGILSASFAMVFKRGDPFGVLLGTGAALFSGVFFPTQLLGSGFGTISRLLPPTYGLDGIRRVLIEGQGLAEVREPLITLFVFLAVLLPFSLWVFGRAVRRAKREGSLIQY
jgi:ABC-2 type transport system permease protein